MAAATCLRAARAALALVLGIFLSGRVCRCTLSTQMSSFTSATSSPLSLMVSERPTVGDLKKWVENNRKLLTPDALALVDGKDQRSLSKIRQLTVPPSLTNSLAMAGNLKRNKPKHNQISDHFISERSARVPDCRGWPSLIRCPSCACPLVPAGAFAFARCCPLVPRFMFGVHAGMFLKAKANSHKRAQATDADHSTLRNVQWTENIAAFDRPIALTHTTSPAQDLTCPQLKVMSHPSLKNDLKNRVCISQAQPQ